MALLKEYAVDRVAYELAECYPDIPVLVNFGGDIACPVPKSEPHGRWALKILAISIAPPVYWRSVRRISDQRRYTALFEVDGKRYGHIVDPRTGYPSSMRRAP